MGELLIALRAPCIIQACLKRAQAAMKIAFAQRPAVVSVCPCLALRYIRYMLMLN